MYGCNIKSKFDIIGLSEVWNVSHPSLFGLEGFNLELNCCQGNVRGGGVGAYIHSSIKYKRLDVNEIPHAESLWLEVLFNKKKVIVGIVDRKPNTCTNINEFQNTLSNVLYSLKLDKHYCVLMGDLNINLIDNY